MSTFTIKIRGASSQPTMAEYMCPVHGRFDLVVERDANGDPPAEAKCEHWFSKEETEAVGHAWHGHPTLFCGEWSPYVISAPMGRVKRGEVTRGKADEKPTPFALDTEALADGMSLKEWKKRRADMWRAKDYAEFKKNIG